MTSMASTFGPEANLLEPAPHACRQIKIEYRIFTTIRSRSFGTFLLARHFVDDASSGWTTPMRMGQGSNERLAESCRKASQAVAAGYGILILGPRCRCEACSDSKPARHRGCSSSPRSGGKPHQVRPARRDR